MNKRKAKKRRKQMEQQDFVLDYNKYLQALPAAFSDVMDYIIDTLQEAAKTINNMLS